MNIICGDNKHSMSLDYVLPRYYDKAIAMSAVAQSASNFMFVCEDLRNDKAIAMLAVKNNSLSLAYVSDSLKNDRDVVLTAINKKPVAIIYAGTEIKKDKKLMSELISKQGWLINSLQDSELKSDLDIAKNAIKTYPKAIEYVTANQMSEAEYKTFLLDAVTINGTVLNFLSNRLRKDHSIVKLAVEENASSFKYACDSLKTNETFIHTLININGLVLEFLDTKYKSNDIIVSNAVMQNISAIKYSMLDAKANYKILNGMTIDVLVKDNQYLKNQLAKSLGALLLEIYKNTQGSLASPKVLPIDLLRQILSCLSLMDIAMIVGMPTNHYRKTVLKKNMSNLAKRNAISMPFTFFSRKRLPVQLDGFFVKHVK